MKVKTDCYHHRYERDGRETYDMCDIHPELIYGVESEDCEKCKSYCQRNLRPLSAVNLYITVMKSERTNTGAIYPQVETMLIPVFSEELASKLRDGFKIVEASAYSTSVSNNLGRNEIW